VSSTPPPTDPSSESGNSGNSGASGGSLPDTGEDDGTNAWTLSLAAALVASGAGLIVWRRRVA
jgi:LPXTG-motif cell wall-anchored protein